MNVERLTGEAEIVVVCGSGGVGKTTVSAALALGAARRGRTACVLTIDPARRLANALGLESLPDEPHEVELGHGSGRLFAIALDAKRTFDRLVEEHAPSAEARDRILRNRIYRQLSGAVGGSQEYMAMERLYELHRRGGYDLLVLDTPPSRHALDFIDAPNRITRFVEGKALRTLLEGGMRAGGLGLRTLGQASLVAWKALERLIGITFLSDLTEFLLGFEGMYDGFKQRAVAVRALLGDRRTVFLLVTTPEREPIEEAVFFWRRLVEAELPFGGVIVNKIHPAVLGDERRRSAATLRRGALGQLVDAGLDPGVAARAADAFLAYQVLAERDRANVRSLARRLGPEPLLELPHLDGDVHDVPGLERLEPHLFAARPPAES
ncbi:MAG: ArsA family ATPase [Thermoleophilia bacterium]|nr:ArsA family ATPase [Thermoleophilia bacterium]